MSSLGAGVGVLAAIGEAVNVGCPGSGVAAGTCVATGKRLSATNLPPSANAISMLPKISATENTPLRMPKIAWRNALIRAVLRLPDG